MPERVVVFVHGWSVFKTDTYGRLPERLALEAPALGLGVSIEHVYLGKYVSFRDEVRVEDVSRAFETALRSERSIADALAAKKRLVVITHSTGGPVVRDWWWRFYVRERRDCPMSHLVMLAPANFGSALAQLGKGVLSRVMKRFEHVEPGTGVLDWLELGSGESWALNREWIHAIPSTVGPAPVFPFVLTGQSIDRSLYNHVNSYTDEMGSDGVVRVAAANLNAAHVELRQVADGKSGALSLQPGVLQQAPRTAFLVVAGRSHSGKDMGILRSVKKTGGHPTVDAVLACLAVSDAASYGELCTRFEQETRRTIEAERVEVQDGFFLTKRTFFHDATTQLVVRFSDDGGHALGDFDFLLTASDPENAEPRLRQPSPDFLPPGFFLDRQRNNRQKSTLTYLLDHDVMVGCPALFDPTDPTRVVRAAQPGAKALGLRVVPRPQFDPKEKREKPLVHFATAELAASLETLRAFVQPHQTLLLDIVVKRIVREGVFRLTRGKRGEDFSVEDFRNQPPGEPIP